MLGNTIKCLIIGMALGSVATIAIASCTNIKEKMIIPNEFKYLKKGVNQYGMNDVLEEEKSEEELLQKYII